MSMSSNDHDPGPDKGPESEEIRIVERADGYYWLDPGTHEHFGPFPSYEEALANSDYAAMDDDEGTSLREAEDALGLSDWVDPDTGLPAEGHVPHISDDY
ncbi:hypothetical protein OPU71_08690 [Niveibacterium sp. 24ML]|uniref:hypothetical protein n=1 Tax=Niveibacterium sp. 24ML TaxID=2985512 RepID=UPI00226E36E0|nr:hypothetical protein [Niveibacterium sp. 24ML]MCX9156196.1 hypothetical protein [Niveibacterium sp. 24ML]